MNRRKIVLVKGKIYNIRGEYFEYLGEYNSVKEVPISRGIFVLGDCLYKRNINHSKIPNNKLIYHQKENESDKDYLDFEINSNDNELMVIVKTILKKVTMSEFKQAFTNTSDMYNMLKTIKQGGDLSWNRYTYIIQKLGGSYELRVRFGDETIDGDSINYNDTTEEE